MRCLLLPYLIGPFVVSGLVFHWNARAASWIVWHVDPWCAYGQKASYYDYLRSRPVESAHLEWLTGGVDPNVSPTANLMLRTIGAYGAAALFAVLFRRYGLPLRFKVLSTDSPGEPK